MKADFAVFTYLINHKASYITGRRYISFFYCDQTQDHLIIQLSETRRGSSHCYTTHSWNPFFFLLFPKICVSTEQKPWKTSLQSSHGKYCTCELSTRSLCQFLLMRMFRIVCTTCLESFSKKMLLANLFEYNKLNVFMVSSGLKMFILFSALLWICAHHNPSASLVLLCDQPVQ